MSHLAHALAKRDQCLNRRRNLVEGRRWSRKSIRRYMKYERDVTRWVIKVRSLKKSCQSITPK